MVIRRRRDAVAVTGAATGLGRLLVERLADRADVAQLVGIDTQAGRTDRVEWRVADVRDPLLRRHLRGVSTLVHLATTRDLDLPAAERTALNVVGTRAVLRAAAKEGVDRVILTTSADVYDVRPGDPLPLPDEAPVRGEVDGGLLGDHVEVERLAAGSGLDVTVLRPAALVGGADDSALLRQLTAPRLLAVRGHEPLWQLCHVDDLLAALELAATGAVTGVAAVACDGWLPQTAVEAIAGRRRVELPASVALGTAERLQRLGLSSASPHDLDHLLAPRVVACDRLRAAGWAPAWTNDAALRAHLAAAPVGRPAAYTAAGATVALLGTAALVRQARRRRRGR